MLDVSITKGYLPGAIGRVAELNGRYYHDNWGLGLFFEAMESHWGQVLDHHFGNHEE